MTEEQRLDAALRRILSPLTANQVPPAVVEKMTDRHVLLSIAMGLVLIELAIIIGLLLTHRVLPNWAENVFVSIATASALKLGDCVNAIVQLSSSRSIDRMGTQLANTSPAPPTDVPTGAPDDPVTVKPVR